MTLVLVDSDQLETLLMLTYELVSGAVTADIIQELNPDDVLVTLAVQAGLRIPGPMRPGTVPPAPPCHRFRGGGACAATYRAQGDPRLRCEQDAKVVYGTMESAESAARAISARQPMKAYLGRCGHYHVARRK